MTEPQDTKQEERHGASHLVHWHVQITKAQKDALQTHCHTYSKSEGKFVREAIQYLLGFYGNLEQDHERKKGGSNVKEKL